MDMKFELKYKIWLDRNGKAFGDGPLELLKNIEKNGSLSKAAKEMNMSYSQAWNLLNTIEKRLGIKLVVSKAGGENGGGSEITDEARALMKKYEEFREKVDNSLWSIFNEIFN
ncbi:winged helix-turn-helix domain-containing protein [Thermovenabulum sp.]|uniref:winged helix-turn-helix domain-containing protein n=1 Tax=Thermovenabulum sp. TaxID=3100335 RepID=UPI003C7EC7C1